MTHFNEPDTASASESVEALLACHDCDLLHRVKIIQEGASARCTRCGAVLYRRPHNSLDRSLALAVAALILFILANIYPFMFFIVEGRVEVNRLFTGVVALYDRGMAPLAALIFFCSIFAPGVKIFLMLYVLAPLKLGRTPPGLARAMRFLQTLGPWGMVEVYMLGVIVAIVNLTAIASILLGTALYCFVALFFISTAAGAYLDPQLVWDRIDEAAS